MHVQYLTSRGCSVIGKNHHHHHHHWLPCPQSLPIPIYSAYTPASQINVPPTCLHLWNSSKFCHINHSGSQKRGHPSLNSIRLGHLFILWSRKFYLHIYKDFNISQHLPRTECCQAHSQTLPLFPIAKLWKEPRRPSTDEWIKKRWDISTMEYYAAIKKHQNLAICNDVAGTRGYCVEQNKSVRERQLS